MYLLDTNIVSYWMCGDRGVIEQLKKRAPSELSLSAVTLAEILYGIEKFPIKKEERRLKIERITSLLDICYFDENAAAHYARIRSGLERKGMTISERDLQIAAVAMANRFVVVTHNVKEFSRVPGLTVEDWAIPLPR